jgi:uncharacterized protein YndB with AHSA1/START domain
VHTTDLRPFQALVAREFDVPPSEVFDAWTDPALLAQWLAPGGEVSVDVRVGGVFSILMRGKGQEYPHRGEYLRIDRPRLLEFTWISDGTEQLPSIVTVQLEDLGGRTRLSLTHRGLPNAQMATAHQSGWAGFLGALEAMLRAR